MFILFARQIFLLWSSKTKCYKELDLSRCGGGLTTDVVSIFMRGGRKSDIMDFLLYREL